MQPGHEWAEGAKETATIEAVVAVAKDEADDLSVVAATRRDLKDLAKRDEPLARSALAASALALARELDNPNSATSKSMCANALRDTLDRLRELAPAEKEQDRLDELADRRTRRLKRASG